MYYFSHTKCGDKEALYTLPGCSKSCGHRQEINKEEIKKCRICGCKFTLKTSSVDCDIPEEYDKWRDEIFSRANDVLDKEYGKNPHTAHKKHQEVIAEYYQGKCPNAVHN